ncbi:MAG: hypothetical protein ABIT07_01125, partial [Ferruginibacter sp.]
VITTSTLQKFFDHPNLHLPLKILRSLNIFSYFKTLIMLAQNIKLKLILLFFMAVSFSSCKKDISSTPPVVQALALNGSGTTTTELCFTPIAILYDCIGENIIFGGVVEFRYHTNVDANGHTHHVREWSIKGLTGQGVLPGGKVNNASTACPRPYTGTLTGNTYDVIAGHEMFSVKDPNSTTGPLNAVLSGDIFIHEGTVVFVNRATGERIVARHEVIKTPEGILRSGWFIKGQKCGS